MMRDTRNARIKIVFVLTATVLVVLYVYLVAPSFLSKIDSLRAENKQIEYDLGEIEKLGDDTTSVERSIETAGKQLAKFEKRTKVDGTNYDMDISKKAEKSGVHITEIIVGERSKIDQQGSDGKILYMEPVTVSFTGNFEDGIEFIKSLENSDTGIYKINDFLYSKGSEGDEKTWMISIDVYYYKSGPR